MFEETKIPLEPVDPSADGSSCVTIGSFGPDPALK